MGRVTRYRPENRCRTRASWQSYGGRSDGWSTARGRRGKGEEPGRVGVATGWDRVGQGGGGHGR